MFPVITDSDIIKLKKVFVTKQELKLEIDRVIKYVDYKTDRLEKAILTLSKELAEFKEHTNKTLDWLVGAFKKFDEEHTILSARYSTVNKTLDNHEERITTLEKSN